MTVSRLHIGWLFVGAIPLVISCQTRVPEPKAPEPEARFEFRPVTYYSRIYMGEGRYSNLYSFQSHAIWVGPEVTELKRQKAIEEGESIEESIEATAKLVEENYIVFECHIESLFPDASIAYDVVGFRNVDVYLQTPDGLKIRPIQRILGSHADEEQRDALKLFRRTNIVIFPKHDILVGRPTIDNKAPGVRLVMEGFNSEFYFEWLAVPPPTEPVSEQARRWLPTRAEAVSVVKVDFSELYSRLRALGRYFK